MQSGNQGEAAHLSSQSLEEIGLRDLAQMVLSRWRFVATSSLVVGGLTFAGSFLLTPQFTAETTFLPPHSSSGGNLSAALASLGPLASLAGGGAAKASGDLYVSLLQSNIISDRVIDQFHLQELYKAKFRFETREVLKKRSRITLGKRDGIITLEVDDVDPKRAADIANKYVEELRILTSSMTLTEAQRRRSFYEAQLKQAREALSRAQIELQQSGFDQSALQSEPKAVAEEYAQLKGQLTEQEIKMRALQSRLVDRAPELTQLAASTAALRERLKSMEQKSASSASQNYVSKYREYRYQETLVELLAKQFEAARLEESQDDSTLQVIDRAETPEWKSKPKRASFGVAGTLIAALVSSIFVIVRRLRAMTRAEYMGPATGQ